MSGMVRPQHVKFEHLYVQRHQQMVTSEEEEDAHYFASHWSKGSCLEAKGVVFSVRDNEEGERGVLERFIQRPIHPVNPIFILILSRVVHHSHPTLS